MGRWTQYDEDAYRLPSGMRRTGYDADTGTYYFTDGHGVYTSEPYVYYGKMKPIGPVQDVEPTAEYSPEQSSSPESDDEFHPVDELIKAATRTADRVIPQVQRLAGNAREVVTDSAKQLGRSASVQTRRLHQNLKPGDGKAKESLMTGSENVGRSATLKSRPKAPWFGSVRGEKRPFPSQGPLFAPSGKPVSRAVSLPQPPTQAAGRDETKHDHTEPGNSSDIVPLPDYIQKYMLMDT